MLPGRFYTARSFMWFHNLIMLLVMWWMGRHSRREKLDLELQFYHRMQRMLLKYDTEFEGYNFEEGL